jgi:hypothetical protein
MSLQEVTLNHTLIHGKYAHPGERVTFTCEARDAEVLEWYSDEYIGSAIEIRSSGRENNQTRLEGNTTATRVSVSTDSGITVIVSQLHIMTSELFPTSSVTCAISAQGPRKVIPFTTTGMKSCTVYMYIPSHFLLFFNTLKNNISPGFYFLLAWLWRPGIKLRRSLMLRSEPTK